MCFDIHVNRHEQNLLESKRRAEGHLDPVNFCKIISNEPLYICDYCADGFLTKELLLIHLFESHKPRSSEQDDVLCHFCSKFFSSTTNLRKHIRRVHEKNKKLFSCDLCEMKFPIFYDLVSFIHT